MRISDWSSDVCSSDLNMLEALGRNCAGVDAGQLGAMCGQINSWPHPTIKKALSTLYGFASEYPGIRHAGNPQSALREMRSEEHTSELQSLMRISYAVFCLKKKKNQMNITIEKICMREP